jgi:predicted ATPase
VTSAAGLAVRGSLAGFVGCGEHVDSLVDQLRDTQLVTLVGPAGVGNMRLAVESVNPLQRPDQRHLPLREPGTDRRRADSGVGDRVRSSGRRLGRLASKAAVRDVRQDRDLVLVLDNCATRLAIWRGSLTCSCPPRPGRRS